MGFQGDDGRPGQLDRIGVDSNDHPFRKEDVPSITKMVLDAIEQTPEHAQLVP